MKRIAYVLTLLIILVGGFSLDRAKHYFIFYKIQQFQKQNKNRLTIDRSSWNRDSVKLTGVHIAPKDSSELKAENQYTISSIEMVHNWSHPLQIQVKANGIIGPNLQVTEMSGGIACGINSISSKNLVITGIDVALKRGNVQFPLANAPFTYHVDEKKLDLDVTIPPSAAGTFKNITFGTKGSLSLKPLTGHLDVHVTNTNQVIETLVEVGVIKKKHAMYYHFGANLFSGGTGESTLPLNFDQGKVYLGPVLIYEK